MGFYMNQTDSSFFIDKKDFDKALAAVKALKNVNALLVSGASMSRRYSWVQENFDEAKTLPDILKAWRWQAQLDKEENISDLNFTGEKLGEEMILFEALAPYVKNGSYIEMRGDENSLWRWVFENGSVVDKTPRVSWD